MKKVKKKVKHLKPGDRVREGFTWHVRGVGRPGESPYVDLYVDFDKVIREHGEKLVWVYADN